MAVMTGQAPVTAQTDIELIIHADHWNPFTVLGLHEVTGGSGKMKDWVVRAFFPEARPGSSTCGAVSPARWCPWS